MMQQFSLDCTITHTARAFSCTPGFLVWGCCLLLGYGMLPQLKSAACSAEEKELLLGERIIRDVAGTKQAMMWEGWSDIKGRQYWYFSVLDLIKTNKKSS